MEKTKLTKGEITRKKILEGAMRVLSIHGEHGMTFEKIAKSCGVSQPLVVHYFKTRDKIFPALLNYVMDFTLHITERAINESQDPRLQLEKYFLVSIEIIRSQPEVAHFYMTLYYLSCFDKRIASVNDKLRSEATERIAKILKSGVESGYFVVNPYLGGKVNGLEATAKMIHNLLTGSILNFISEGTPVYSDQTLLKILRDFCYRELSMSSF